MTLRRRLTLAFAVLLGLFAVNLLIHLWSDHRRHDVLDHLHEAVDRQLRSVSARPPGDERAFEVHLVTEEHRAVDETLDALLDLSHSASRLTLGVFLASALVAGLVAARTFRQLDARLGQLRDGAERIGAGDLSTPIPVDGRDELGRFAQVFNDMAARLAALRETESLLRQEERMASLGKVAAGLAHELNNPAAALRRNIAALGDQLAALGRLGDELASGSAGSSSLAGSLAALGADTPAAAGALDALDPLARSEREGEMEELLERHGVDRSWELAPDLVRVGVDPAALDPRVRALPEADRAPALTWWARTRVAEALLAESTVSARRLSEIVGAVGRYSHLGEAPVGDVDLRAGLEDTLTVLRSRLSGVRVEADLASGLPPVEGHAGELNQVWTILIDNALDAMTEARGGEVGDGAELGRLWLATRRAGDGRVAVEVRDDGPGIPAELRRSIFDPFFTTKPVGSGTGLGLHIARQIVERHGGEIEVESGDGGTRFRVLLPVVGARVGPEAPSSRE